MDTIPDQATIRPGRAAAALAALLGLVALLCVGAVALPHNRYIRYQQFAAGDFSMARYIYERIHFDSTPIDVAVIGSSRVQAAVSTGALQRTLSTEIGRPIHVAALAAPMEGRDAHYVIAHELLRQHPETRLVILSLVEPIRRSHPAFKNIADVRDVLGAPIWLNHYWLENVAFLPYRNMSLFVQSQFPALFGMDAAFDRDHYARYGTDFDSTRGFRMDNGKLVSSDRQEPLDTLEAAVRARRRGGPSALARLIGADDNIIENRLTAKLGAELRARCAALVLLHLPIYKGDPDEVDLARNQRAAPVLMTPSWIGADWQDYSDAGHLRSRGADQVTRWLPGALRPYVGPLARPPRCPR